VLTTAKATRGTVTTEPQPRTEVAAFAERLHTPWSYYLGASVMAFLLALELAVALPHWWGLIPFVVLIALAIYAIYRLGAGRVMVRDGALIAGESSVDIRWIVEVIPLKGESVRRLVGRHGDPTAYVYYRSWISSAVQLVLDGSVQPTDELVPYWLVSTRRPDELIAALRASGLR